MKAKNKEENEEKEEEGKARKASGNIKVAGTTSCLNEATSTTVLPSGFGKTIS